MKPMTDHQPIKHASFNNSQNPLRLTREEVRVLTYFRALSKTDREAARCLLHAMQKSQPAFNSTT
ncbi:hypothetical protein V9L16_19175 [Pseudomonas tolaasii]|uniref:hypothetical protein n=1 Tax=Pseudomonas tolaasii TaxID=29442 RepID=UPI0030CF8472